MAPRTKLETQILEELEYSDLSSDALKKRTKECVIRVLGAMEEKKLVREYQNEKTGEMLWRKL